jgi:chromosomal replication initiation ATPase DnaA
MNCQVVSIGRPEPVRIERAAESAACCVAELLVAAVYSVPLPALRAPHRGPARIAFARQLAMYLAHVAMGEPLWVVAAHFGRDRSTVAHACARIEDEREDAALDQRLGGLEAALQHWRRSMAREDA